jgi:hypothetical protein
MNSEIRTEAAFYVEYINRIFLAVFVCEIVSDKNICSVRVQFKNELFRKRIRRKYRERKDRKKN